MTKVESPPPPWETQLVFHTGYGDYTKRAERTGRRPDRSLEKPVHVELADFHGEEEE